MDRIKEDDVLQQAQNIWTMLDDMAANDPQAYRKFIDKQMSEGKKYHEPPKPHMCVQTVMYEPEKKPFFMNIFGWMRVPPPKSDDDPIPVVGGALSKENDEEGPYVLVTVAFNPKVLEDFGRNAKNSEERRLLINLATDFVEDSRKVRLSRNYTILPTDIICKSSIENAVNSLKLVYQKQDLQMDQQMEDLKTEFAPMSTFDKDQLFEQLLKGKTEQTPQDPGLKLPSEKTLQSCNSSDKKTKLIQELSSSGFNLRKPDYSLVIKDLDGDKTQKLILKIELPGVESVQECDLDVSEEDVSLVVKDKYELCVTLPEKIVQDHAKAKFSTRSSNLTITMPCHNS